jgi:hypothetical protein
MPTSNLALVAPIAAILAALIAAAISFIALLVSKENKVSEFRQAWIDALRADLSDYIAALGLLTYAEPRWINGEEDDETTWHEYLKTMHPTFEKLASARTRIRLRINGEDTDSKLRALNISLLQNVDKIQTLITERKYKEVHELAGKLHEVAAPILKLEWKRVKRGEPLYRLAKWFTGFAVLGAFVLTLCAAALSIRQLLP